MTTLESTTALVGAAPARKKASNGSFRRLRVGPVVSVLFLVFLVAAVVDPSLLAHCQPLAVNPANSLQAPSFGHLFGTDESGRDVFSRVIYGATPSLSIGLAATALGLVLATVLGAAAALGGRVVDAIIGRFLEILFAFPALLLALLFVTIFGASVTSLIISVGLGSAPGYARMVRGQILAVKNAPYVEASYVLGHSGWRVFRRTILPNAMRPLLVLGTLGIGQSIVWASSLSFLGLGAAPPAPEWGAMLADGREFIASAWWVELFPGAMIVLVTLATTSLGRYLQRRLEGRGSERVSVLEVKNLRIGFGLGADAREVVGGISFSLEAGECLAIVGESGSGKSVSARSVIGLTGAASRVTADALSLNGMDVRGLPDRKWRSIRGREVGFILQDALVSLDPLRPVGKEITETLRLHRWGTARERHARVLELLEQVGVPEPNLRARQLSGELSGGQRQRALIASAIALDPGLLIADEPTTALDVTVQAQILDLLEKTKARGKALLMISHDLAVVARLADRVAVMNQGVIVEQGPVDQVLSNPKDAYTQRLLDAVPGAHSRGTRLSPTTPSQFSTAARRVHRASEPLITVDRVSKSYKGPDGRTRTVVRDVSFELGVGETVGVVGESGSGKTTVARLVLAVTPPDSGEIRLAGAAWSGLAESQRRARRRLITTVYQDPLSSFDPRWNVGQLLRDALPRDRYRGAARNDRVDELLVLVGLSPEFAARRPIELSGGQRQRVAIARALAPEPAVIVCDESVSALDVSIQAQVLDLLSDIQNQLGVSYLFISHDLGVIHHVSDRILVMHNGRIVEQGNADEIFLHPKEQYTKQLLGSLPRIPVPAGS